MVNGQINKKINFKNKKVGFSEPTFVIAEIGINHNGDMKIAKELILKAKESGADAVKFQTYITEKRVPKNHEVFDILKKCEISFENQEKLFKYAENNDILSFSTPFDKESALFLNSIDCPVFKIASFDTVNHNLLSCVSDLKRPIILSTGMTNISELNDALKIIGSADLALLHCVSSYPLDNFNADLNVIKTLISLNIGPVGYSDHSLGIEVPILAVACGAKIIEKHFTLNRKENGPDHALSSDPKTLSNLVKEIRRVEKVLGNSELRIRDCEKNAESFRRYSEKN